MAIINTTGITVNQTNNITKEGNYLLKIVKIEQDGFEKFKLTFEGKEILSDGKLGTETYSMLDWLELKDNLKWKIVRLRDALQAPEVFDLDDFLNRFVTAKVTMNTYNGKTNPQFATLSYSKFNDKMPPFREVKQEFNELRMEDVPMHNNPKVEQRIPEIDIDDDKIPFAPIGLQYPCLLH